MPYILLFENITQLYRAEAELKKRGIVYQLIPMPDLPDYEENACGENVILVDNPDVENLFKEAKIFKVNEEILSEP
ncbi:DUF3343 domain-containing protein [bacterium]|nr:DUF3343 domain-containing protein [bacterium]